MAEGMTEAEQRDFALAALNSAQQRANTLAGKLLTLKERAAAHRWMIVHSYDHGQMDVYTGTLDEMLTLYDRLAIQWTGVTLAEVYVPDANSVRGGEARRLFEALRDASGEAISEQQSTPAAHAATTTQRESAGGE